MMEVTQNVELKELPTEDELMRSIAAELDEEVDKLTTPDIASAAGSRKSTVDEELQHGLEADELDTDIDATPPSESVLNDFTNQAAASVTGISKERDAGTDLDALLDKISSIVDYDSKESVDEEIEEDSATAEADKQPANDIDSKVECKSDIDNTKTEAIEIEEDQMEEAHDNNVDAEVVKEKVEESEEKEDKQIIAESVETETVEAKEKIVDSKEEESEEKTIENPEAKTAPSDVSDTTAADLNTTSDEIFMDALETISSSDEFDGTPDEKSSPKKDTVNGLEDITSDDSLDKDNPVAEKPTAEPAIIDLDTLDDALKVETSEDSVKDAMEGNKSILEQIEKHVEKVEAKAVGNVQLPAMEENESILAQIEKHVEKVEAKAVGNVQLPAMEGNESILEQIEKHVEKVEAKAVGNAQLTATQELRDEAMDDMLVEAAETCEAAAEEVKEETEAEAGTSKESEDLVNGEADDLPVAETVKTNGTEDKVDEQTSSEVSKKEPKEAESDDEVIFFESIDKKATTETEKAKPNTEDVVEEIEVEEIRKEDEVVLVSEDEDEVSPVKQPVEDESSKKSEKEATTTPETDAKSKSDLLVDNSDNACDQFEKQRALEKTPPKAVAGEDSNSSNLLQPTQKSQEETPPEAEPEAEAETTAEVELADAEAEEETEEPYAPAVKRIRLSTDYKPEVSNSSSCTAEATTSTSTTQTTNENEIQPAVAKRHQSLSETREDIPNKKLKTDDTDSNSSCDGNLQIDLDAHDNTEESETPAESTKEHIKEPPIELSPAPELKTDVKPMRLEFLKRFEKSFDKMTRCDLEELVLQKVVEAMLVKSEFAEIRRQVDKQEATLANYRRKIAEVSKQFLDLETVHKRVLKDLETRNSHFTAPVRITRAVGLQVGMALMKKPSEEASRNQTSHHTAGSMLAPTPSSSSQVAASAPATSLSPKAAQRSPLRGMKRGGPLLPNSPQQLHQQLQQQQQQQQQQRSSLTYSQAAANATTPVRRGCMQKVTPQRPVNNSTQSSPSGPGAMQRLQTSPGSSSRIYATKHTSNSAAATAATMRSRGAVGKPAGAAYMTAKQLMQQQQMQQQQQQQQSPLPVRIGRIPGKPNNTKTRSMPMGGGTVSVPMSSASADSAGTGYGQPSLAPARPKEKAVIDLTDEDDAAAAAAAEVTARLQQNPNVGVKRAGSSAAGGARPVAGSVVRVSPMNMGRSSAVSRQIVNNNSAGQRNSIGNNVTMQIRSENTPPSPSRKRFTHPAPLPLAPAQTFHPNWRLPPSRPEIRISLHDSGIVISWTLEDAGSRFAECVTYQIYAYQETINEPSTDSWRHVGDVKAMLLPMAVTLNQFQENQRYYFAVRGVDAHDRYGVFSLPKTW